MVMNELHSPENEILQTYVMNVHIILFKITNELHSLANAFPQF